MTSLFRLHLFFQETFVVGWKTPEGATASLRGLPWMEFPADDDNNGHEQSMLCLYKDRWYQQILKEVNGLLHPTQEREKKKHFSLINCGKGGKIPFHDYKARKDFFLLQLRKSNGSHIK